MWRSFILVAVASSLLAAIAHADIHVSDPTLRLSVSLPDARWQKTATTVNTTTQRSRANVLGAWSFDRADGRAHATVIVELVPGLDRTFAWRDRAKLLETFVSIARSAYRDAGDVDVTELERSVSEKDLSWQFRMSGRKDTTWARSVTACFARGAASQYTLTYVCRGEPTPRDAEEAVRLLGAMKIDLVAAQKLFATKDDELDDAQRASLKHWRTLLAPGAAIVAIGMCFWVWQRAKKRRMGL